MELETKARPCSFCHTDTDDELNLGQLKQLKKVRVHYYCLLLSSTVSQSGADHKGILGFTLADINGEINRCLNRICCYCGKNRANLKCMSRKKCERYFHLPCGLKNKAAHEFLNKYRSFCHEHRKVAQIPPSITNHFGKIECAICYDVVDTSSDVRELYVPKCCKSKSLMHISCLKKFALSAGYFMKCPICNNVNAFVSDIRFHGVFVPNRDALWEKDRHAYEDLLERYSQCDAENCSCPHKNRNKHANKLKRKPWYILTCEACGGSGIHRHCNNYQTSYVCKTCQIFSDLQNRVQTEPVTPPEDGDSGTNITSANDCSTGKVCYGKIVVYSDLLDGLHVTCEDDRVEIRSADEPSNCFYLTEIERTDADGDDYCLYLNERLANDQIKKCVTNEVSANDDRNQSVQKFNDTDRAPEMIGNSCNAEKGKENNLNEDNLWEVDGKRRRIS